MKELSLRPCDWEIIRTALVNYAAAWDCTVEHKKCILGVIQSVATCLHPDAKETEIRRLERRIDAISATATSLDSLVGTLQRRFERIESIINRLEQSFL